MRRLFYYCDIAMNYKINSLLQRISRFTIVGAISTGVNYGCFVLLYTTVQLHYILSSSIGYIIGLLLGYSLNKNWTFIKKVNHDKSYIIQYTIAQIMALIFCQALLFFLVEFLLFGPLVANIIALAVAAIVSFLLIDIFVFKPMHKKTISNTRQS